MEQGEPKITAFKINAEEKKVKGVIVTHSRSYVDARGKIVPVTSPDQFHGVEPHPDLVELFKKLSVHYAKLTEREEHDESGLEDQATIDECAKNYPCGSIQFLDKDTWSGVQFHGAKVLSTGHHCNSLTRLVKFNSATPDYDLSDQLQELTNAIRAEVVLLLAGKHAAPAQMSILDPEQAVEKEEEESLVRKTRKKRS